MIRAKTKRERPISEINVVPYIDVMLVLLVIFMITAPMLSQGSLLTFRRLQVRLWLLQIENLLLFQ